MNLCSDGHEEVCYDGRNCPACEAILALKKELAATQDELDALRDELTESKEESR